MQIGHAWVAGTQKLSFTNDPAKEKFYGFINIQHTFHRIYRDACAIFHDF